MQIFTAIGLVIIASALFVIWRKKLIANETLNGMAAIGGIVAGLAAIILFLVPAAQTPSMPASQSSQTGQPLPTQQKSILVDTYHGNSLFEMKGGDGAVLMNKGFLFSEVTRTLMLDDLSQYEALVIYFVRTNNGKPQYSKDEIDVIQQYIRQGGSAFLIGIGWVWANDSPKNGWKAQPIADYPLNQIAYSSGISFTAQYINYSPGNESPLIFQKSFMADHPITNGIDRISSVNATPGTLYLAPPANALIWGDDKTKDSENISKPIVMATSKLGEGKIVALQHIDLISPATKEYQNIKLFENTLDWLTSN